MPKEIAKALASGKLSVSDYYELQNVQADTAMRNSLSKSETEKAEKIATVQKTESSNNSMPKPFPPIGQSQTPPSFGGFGGQPMNPLAARFASLAAAQRKNNDDKKS